MDPSLAATRRQTPTTSPESDTTYRLRIAAYELAKIAQVAHGLIKPTMATEQQCADQLQEAIWKVEMALTDLPNDHVGIDLDLTKTVG